MSARDRRYSTAAWQRLRRGVLAHDGRICQIQGPRCLGIANTVDHIVPSSVRPDLFWEPENLRPAGAATTAARPRSSARRSPSSAPSSSCSSRRSTCCSSGSPATRFSTASPGNAPSRRSISRARSGLNRMRAEGRADPPLRRVQDPGYRPSVSAGLPTSLMTSRRSSPSTARPAQSESSAVSDPWRRRLTRVTSKERLL